jgi:hypothetical protein
MFSLSIAWQRLDKHISVATDTKASIEGIVRDGVFYAVLAEIIQCLSSFFMS